MNERREKTMRKKRLCTKEYIDRAIAYQKQNLAAELLAYVKNTIILPESRRWDYAIPENYTNYQDGFLYQDSDPYRGAPLLNYRGTILYLHRILGWSELDEGEVEKYLLFDRNGNKYTFVVTAEEYDKSKGNPSYYDFLRRVKKYAPTRAALICKKIEEMKNRKENTKC